ncbi:hypothetical protein L2E82_45313 [Cichorium intybus]|uniref:Uncharacterized protein n=1 Tax=Cichorium intybus TaxID=13427 RepID=A0ACB8ZTL7_CICIN|nr:hypothetical protein L2E82_45313 [Cichorium intybus]
MPLIIDPEFRRDLKFLGSDELAQLEGKPDMTVMEKHSMLTMYESFMEKHSFIDSAASGLSPAIRHIKKCSRSSGSVLRCPKLGIHKVGHSHGKIEKMLRSQTVYQLRNILKLGTPDP